MFSFIADGLFVPPLLRTVLYSMDGGVCLTFMGLLTHEQWEATHDYWDIPKFILALFLNMMLWGGVLFTACFLLAIPVVLIGKLM